jgi:hypothetical protein
MKASIAWTRRPIAVLLSAVWFGAFAAFAAFAGCGAPPLSKVAGRAAAWSRPAAAAGWSALSWEERHDAMTWVVHPNMAALFQRFEGTADPELTCRTCHGTDAEQVGYKMPHGLTPLDPSRLPDPNGGGPKARIARFMTEEVTPQMADLLGVEPYDPHTGRGFGCFGCHPATP